MANLTFIIGNGLDISLGLNTSYRSFYKYVVDNNLHPKNRIYKAIAKEDPNWWADFESGLGRYTNKIEEVPETERVQWSESLNEELDEIKTDLKSYVRSQNDLADERLKTIEFSARSAYAGLEVGQTTNISRHLGLDNGSSTLITFITLNYTDVLEKLFPNHYRASVTRDYRLAHPVHHIHGSIRRQISLGVNDESQLSSYIDPEEKRYLIKPELIEEMNDNRIETLDSHIIQTDVMVLFGLSIGETDKYIWQKIVDWLTRYPDKILIIHHFEEGLSVEELTERQSLKLSDRVKNKLLDSTSANDDLKKLLKKKIYVIPNTTELFKYTD